MALGLGAFFGQKFSAFLLAAVGVRNLGASRWKIVGVSPTVPRETCPPFHGFGVSVPRETRVKRGCETPQKYL